MFFARIILSPSAVRQLHVAGNISVTCAHSNELQLILRQRKRCLTALSDDQTETVEGEGRPFIPFTHNIHSE